MGKIILLFILQILILSSVKSQNTFIPDNNFEQALIALGYDSGPLDDSVLTANIVNIDSLIITNSGIISLEGIEDFSSLQYLDVKNNLIVHLDLSRNLNLLRVYCNNNNLSSLNLANGNNTQYQRMHAQSNPNLTCIEVDNANYSSLRWIPNSGGLTCLGCFWIDAQSNYSEDCYWRHFIKKERINYANNYSAYYGPTSNLFFVTLFPDSTVTMFQHPSFLYTNQYINSAAMVYDKASEVFEYTTFYKPNVPTVLDSIGSTGYYVKGRAGHIDTLIYRVVMSNAGNNLNTESYFTGQSLNYAYDTVRFQNLIYDDINDSIPGTVLEYKVPLDASVVSSNSGQIYTKIAVGLEVSKFFAITIDYKPGGIYFAGDTMGKRIGGYQAYAYDLNGGNTPYRVYNPDDLTCANWKSSGMANTSPWYKKYIPSYAYSSGMSAEAYDIDLVISQSNFYCDTVLDTINLNCASQQFVIWNNGRYQNSGDYTLLDTFYNQGCDTLKMLHLVFSRNTFDTVTITSLIPYVSPSGNLYTVSGVYSDTMPNTWGCDSIISINLRIQNCKAEFYPIQLIAGGVYLVDSTKGNNLKYKWFFGDGDSSSLYYPSHVYNNSGSYNVCLYITDSVSGCTDFYCDTITVDSTGVLRNSWTLNVVKTAPSIGVKDNMINSLQLYPNPTTGVLFVEFYELASYHLFSIDGKRVIKSGMLQPERTRINISDLKSGVYLFRIVTKKGEVLTERIIKQ